MSVIHAKDNLEVVGSKKTKLLLTLLLVLLQHAQSSPPFGDSSPLPNLPESRSSRQIQITPGGLIRGDLLVEVPLTIFLSTIGINGGSNFKRLSRNESERDKRSLNLERKEYSFNSFNDPLLSRLDAFFFYLQIPDDICQEKAICEIVQHKLKFSPLSEYLSSLFRRSSKHPLNGDKNSALRWDRYTYAASIGQNLTGIMESCTERFSSCSYSTEKIINVPALRIWQSIAKKISIKVLDQ